MKKAAPLSVALALVACACWALALAACGGGGGSSPTEPAPPPAPMPTPAGTNLTLDSSPGGNTLYPAQDPGFTEQLGLVINAVELPNIATLEFDMVYPSAFLASNIASLHEWDETNSGTEPMTVSDTPGRWRVRLERPVSGSFSGTHSVVEFLFDYVGTPGQGRVEIQNIQATRPDGTEAPPINGLGGVLDFN